MSYLKEYNPYCPDLLICKQLMINAYKGGHGIVRNNMVDESVFHELTMENGTKIEFLRATLLDKSTGRNKIYYSFQGSSDIRDWISNFKFYKKEYGEHHYHSCFLDQYLFFKENFEQFSKDIENNSPDDLWFTGHSLGAAIASIACYEAMGESYFFACPPVATKEFVDSFASVCPKSYSFLFKGDMIQLNVLTMFGYADHGKIIQVGDPRVENAFDHCPEFYYTWI